MLIVCRKPAHTSTLTNDSLVFCDREHAGSAATVTVGVLEGSNVSTVHTLVKFIDHMRSFEMQTKVIKEMKDNDARGEALMRLS